MNPTNASDIFVALIETHKGLIYKVANAYCKNAEDRKDLIQEIIIQLWRSYNSYNSAYKHSTWMYRIALNVAISFYRKENRRKQYVHTASDDILQLIDTGMPPDTTEQLGQLQQFIAELKELDKALLLLYLEEKSHKEIAAITGLTETNVGTRIGRIKKILQQKFSTIKS